MDHFEGTIGVHAGEAIGIFEGEVVDEAVVAGGALEIHAHEDLGNVLGGLHLRCLGGIDDAAPDDAFGESFALGSGVDELGDEAVVRQVGEEGRVEPLGDLFAPAVNVAGASVIVAKEASNSSGGGSSPIRSR